MNNSLKNGTVLVVMPIYNAEKTLSMAIDSILNQSYKDIKLVLVDDASQDGSLEIAKNYRNKDPRVTLISNYQNRGAYYSRNIGLYKFRNEQWGYFTTHDADDISYPNRIKLMVQQFNNSLVAAVQDTFERKYLSNNKSISSSLTIAHAMFPRAIFDKIGFFEEKRFGADWEHWARVVLYAKINGMITKSIRQKQGESFVSENNLTVQVPIGSIDRSNYVKRSKEIHRKMTEKNNFFISFNPNRKPLPPIKTTEVKLSPETIQPQPRTKSYVSKETKNKQPKVTVVLLTWQRIGELKKTLKMLSNQTYKKFDIRISNGNLKYSNIVEKNGKMFADQLDISISHDGNEIHSFRRFTVGKELTKSGTDIILFIDDDITFGPDYIENCLRYYEPNSYKSGFAWSFQANGENYYKYRTRINDYTSKIHYCGTGISIIDAKIFLDDRLIKRAPPEAYRIEDLWLSYFAQHVCKWKLGYIEMKDVVIGGSDSAALYKEILNDKKTKGTPDKADFLKMLVARQYGWKL
jgi:glycosyltransferase involved in cell wall biosynthesis